MSLFSTMGNLSSSPLPVLVYLSWFMLICLPWMSWGLISFGLQNTLSSPGKAVYAITAVSLQDNFLGIPRGSSSSSQRTTPKARYSKHKTLQSPSVTRESKVSGAVFWCHIQQNCWGSYRKVLSKTLPTASFRINKASKKNQTNQPNENLKNGNIRGKNREINNTNKSTMGVS